MTIHFNPGDHSLLYYFPHILTLHIPFNPSSPTSSSPSASFLRFLFHPFAISYTTFPQTPDSNSPIMYPLTFISASPPIRNSSLAPSTTAPLMIAAPKRRGRPPKHPTSNTSALHSRSNRAHLHQNQIAAEQAALAVLEQNPHLLAEDHPHLTPSNPSPDSSSLPATTNPTHHPRPRHSRSTRSNRKPTTPRQRISRKVPTPPPATSAKSHPDPSHPLTSQNTSAQPPKKPPSESKKEPIWTSNSSADNSVRWYLHLIGGDRLLRQDEEVELGRRIRDLMAWQRQFVQLADTIGRQPTVDEWAQFMHQDPEDFKKKLFEARRAKDRMVVCNLRLVVSIAKRYLNRGMPLSDLIQEGTLGLIRACEKFDAEKGFKFSTYATWWVRQAVSRSIADQSRTIRLPVHLYDTITAIRRATKFLTNELGRPPLEQEIADYCNISIEKLRLTRVNMQAAMPLDCPLSSTEDALTLSDVIESDQESPEDRVESSLLRDDLEHVVNSLTPRERDVVRMRYGLDDGRAKTLEEIGRVFDVTKERVRQIESKALRKLRHPYRSAVLREYTPPEQ